MTKQNEKWCCRLLFGAMGDLAQDRNGAFCYRATAKGTVILSAPLISLTRSTMTLTPAGASFILDNLPDDHTPRELTALRALAGNAGY